jgi:hypothetical protein
MAACVGYAAGFSSSGLEACQSLAAGSDSTAQCIAYIIGTGGSQGSCVDASLHVGDGLLADCLLGLSGQSYWGYTSCRLYYEKFL